MVIMSTSSPEVLSQFLGRTPTVFGLKIFEFFFFFFFFGGGGGGVGGRGGKFSDYFLGWPDLSRDFGVFMLLYRMNF